MGLLSIEKQPDCATAVAEAKHLQGNVEVTTIGNATAGRALGMTAESC